MKILVVGGTRFFGIPMVKKLLAAGHDVTIATRGNAIIPFNEKIEQIVMDRSDYESVRSALEGKEYDVVIDKIAYSSNDVKTLLENVRCNKYIQMSTCSVYSNDHEGIKESEFEPDKHDLVWMDRNENYPEGKRLAERAALEYLDISKCIFVRYPVVMGENDYTGRLKFYAEHIKEEKPMYVDDPDFEMSFIHEKEAGEFIAHLVGKDIYGAVNGSSVGMISPGDIIKSYEEHLGKRAILEVKADPAPYNGALANISYDLSKAEATGFKFSFLKDWIYDLMESYL